MESRDSSLLVSVIIATNRNSPFLEAALISVEQQTYPCWEVIVVDDGVPDHEQLERVVSGHAQVRVIRQRAAGVSTARNVGVAQSSGELCAFLDDDDEWLPERLQLQVDAMAQDPEAVLAYGRISSIDASGGQIAPADQRSARNLVEIFNGSATPNFGTVTIRRHSLLRVGGFHSALSYAEDLDLILRLAREGSFVFIDQELVRYRWHGDNVTRNYRDLATSIRTVADLHRLAARAALDGTDGALVERRRRNGRYVAWQATRAARGAVHRREPHRAAAELLWALRFAPAAPVRATLARLRSRVGRR